MGAKSLLTTSSQQHVSCLQKLTTIIGKASKHDLHELLEVVNTTNDTDLQYKLFSILATYLIKTEFHNDIIIKCRLLYDTLHDHLSKGPPLNMGKTLNFIIALISVKEFQTEKCKSLSLYAQNMLRTSGCLATICNLFTCTLDTWVALCHCLAEACQGSEINQSYCSHLVSLCIPKCKQGSMEIFALLHSLLNNHQRNTELFLNNGGLSIFTREYLQFDTCMQLLDSVILISKKAANLICDSEVIKYLQHFLQACGPYSQIGQWSTIILYHLNMPTKEIGQRSELPDTTSAIAMSVSEEVSIEVREKTIIQTATEKPNADDTALLLQNVIREVMQWNTSKKSAHRNLKRYTFSNQQPTLEKSFRTISDQNINSATRYTSPSQLKDVSFSSLFSHGTALMSTRNNTRDKMVKGKSSTKKDVTTQTNVCSTSNPKLPNDSLVNESNIIFKPVITSTPKTSKQYREKIRSNSITITSFNRNNYTQHKKNIKAKRLPKVKKQKCDKTVSPIKELNKTLGSKLFSAMNDSCTFLVNSVRNIFKVKNTTIEKNTNKNSTACEYSFTNYMHKRDELSNEQFSHSDPNDSDNFSVHKNYPSACRTCNDTTELKHKLNNDEHLKQTVKKLKCGINLYGCDFKKISKVMWPRDSYMTPQVLYNLYRKLLVK